MNHNGTISGNTYIWGKLIQYTGLIIDPEDLQLPDDMKIEHWSKSPGMGHLTIMGVKVAGPSRLELMRSFAY